MIALGAWTDSLLGLISLMVGGGLFLWLGAELLVAGSSRIAMRCGVSPFLIGATIIAFGTSAPELVVSFLAHWNGDSAMSFGNLLGSNVCNLALVLGVTALLLPVRVRSRTLRRELPLVLGAEVLFAILAFDGDLTLGDGIVFLTAFALIYLYLTRTSRQQVEQEAQESTGTSVESPLAKDLGSTLIGLIALVGGATAFVDGAEAFALRMGMTQAAVGATVVAIGTSLPELVTSVVAALRGHLDISLGNLLGSNLFNVLLVGGCLGMVGTVPIASPDFVHVWWMLGVTLAVFPIATYRRLYQTQPVPRIDRLGGIVLVAMYVVYIVSVLI